MSTSIVRVDAGIVPVVDAETDDLATKAIAYAAQIRTLADMVEANPALMKITGWSHLLDYSHLYAQTKDAVAALAVAGARTPGVKVAKHQTDKWAGVDLVFGDRLLLHVFVDREEICERIVVGTREVTEEVPDPDALAAVPTVTVTKTVEDVEWRCTPLLATDAEVAAAILTPDAEVAA